MKNLPQNVFAVVVLVIALLVILIVQRPHSICQSQEEVFRSSQSPFLFSEGKTSGFQRALEFCKSTNSPGGCLEFFDGMKKLHSDLVQSPSGCASSLAHINEVERAVFDGAELMVRLAWGERAPREPTDRNGWLDRSHISVFCGYKKLMMDSFGEDGWSSFVEKLLTTLPEAGQLSRNDVWSRTLLSDTCTTF